MLNTKLCAVSLFTLLIFVSFHRGYHAMMCFSEADSALHECRFWAMVAPSLPESDVMTHLVNGSYSLKTLGSYNYNGWGLAYYNDTEPVVRRGKPPAAVDQAFDLASLELSKSGARVGVGHVRLATSGAADIPNPHPFIRYKGGKWWAYGHNGGLSKHSLRELIGPEYLAQNPPTVGDDWNDPRVVDSDLYMLYILKCTEEKGWNVTRGIAKAVRDITRNTSGTMNFFLTDGETLWAFRLGNTLYYYHHNSSTSYSAVASQPPTTDAEAWTALTDYNLVVLTVSSPPIIVNNVTTIQEYSLIGDLNNDHKVDIRDIAEASLAFGSYPDHPRWDQNADLNRDKKVDIKDLVYIAKNFGKTYS